MQLSPRLWRYAPALDAVALVVFVVLGRDRHSISGGVVWAVKVLWPLAVGFTVMGLATGLYRRADGMWWRLAATVPSAVLVGGVLRRIFRGMPAVSAFTVVAIAFLGLTMFGWRLVAAGLVRARHRSLPADA